MTHTIQDLLNYSAKQYGSQTALIDTQGHKLAYSELFTQIKTLKKSLYSAGINKDSRIAFAFPDGIEMAITFLGISSSAIAAPLNPGYRAHEFSFYLEDLKASAVVIPADSSCEIRQVAIELGIPVFELKKVTGKLVNWEIDCQPVPKTIKPDEVQANDIALVLHTSGTTSRPKMVPLTNGNLVASARNIIETLHLTDSDRSLTVMPLFHIHGLLAGLLAPLTAGGTVICSPGFRAADFYTWLDEYKPTYYSAVPTMHQAVLAGAPSAMEVIKRCPLRFIRSSSASLPVQVMLSLEETFHAPVIEAYGMTEAAHQMASNPLPPCTRKAGSVGLPAGPQIQIMDEAGNIILSPGKGEIAIRGTNVMHGYADNDKANATAFTQGWFRTGDQGYFDEDGYLYISSRIKEIINRGGEKVAPREVDEVLLMHPTVLQAVTFGVSHPTLGEDISAAVVLKPGELSSENELRQFLLELLAASKVPSRIIFVKEIPKGPTGKLQRIGLAEKLAPNLKTDFVPPQGEFEEALAVVWEEILGIHPVGAMDNFFYLGGDSLTALRLISRIQSALEIDLPVGTIFQHPNLRDQARTVEAITLQALNSTSQVQLNNASQG